MEAPPILRRGSCVTARPSDSDMEQVMPSLSNRVTAVTDKNNAGPHYDCLDELL